MKRTLLRVENPTTAPFRVSEGTRVTPSRSFLFALFLISLIGNCLYLHRLPTPSDSFVWLGNGLHVRTPDGTYRSYVLPASGTSDGDITFWMNNLVFWSADKQMLALFSGSRPLRWIPVARLKNRSIRMAADRSGVVISTSCDYPDAEQDLRVLRIQLPSGVVHEVADAVSFDCCESSNDLVVETRRGKLEYRSSGSRRPLNSLRPTDKAWGSAQSWSYDFQHHLLCTVAHKAVFLWAGHKKVCSVNSPDGVWSVLLQPEKLQFYVLSPPRMFTVDLDCYDYGGKLKTHLTVDKFLSPPLHAPTSEQLATLARLPLAAR